MDPNNTDFSPDNWGEAHPWRVVAEIAARQHAVIASWQLLEIEFAPKWIEYQVKVRRFHRIHQGVYSVGHRRINRRGYWMAAVLACGRTAFLSHRTAAALHGLLYPRDGWPHVTAPTNGRRKRRRIVVHQALVPDAQRTIVDDIPTTTIPRVLLDLAHSRDPLLSYAIETADDDGLLDFAAIDELVGQKGIKRLRQAIKTYEPTPHWTRSRLEKRFFRLCRRHGIPLPSVNQWIAGYEVDMVWREQRLIVEIDGAAHDKNSARRKDPIRDTKLQLAGYRVFRVTDARLINDPDGVIADVTEALRQAA